MSVEIENVRKDVRMHVETDSLMSSAWLLVYLLPIVVAIVWVLVFVVTMISILVTVSPTPTPQYPLVTAEQLAPLYALIGFLYLCMIVGVVASVILIYRLVRRRNTHFRRQIFFYEDVVAVLRAIAAKKGVDIEVGLASSERTVREVKAEETEKGAVLWAILSAFVFLAQWYVWYFLMNDFYKHERREEGFWEDMSRMLEKCGVKFSVPRRMEPVPERSFVLYLILTIITCGLFGVYWMYVLLKDPNQHFKYHVQVEDQLLSTLETAVV